MAVADAADHPRVVAEETHLQTREHVLTTLPPVMHPLCFQDVIEMGRGILRRVVSARKDSGNPLMTPEHPWEGRFIGYPGVVREPASGLWRMWYPCAADGTSTVDGTSGHGMACAESDNGRTWRRPAFGRYSFAGSTANNICHVGMAGAVIRDETAPSERRYRMFTNRMYENTGCIYSLISPDGLQWAMLHDRQIHIRNDSQNLGFKCPYTGKWFVYHRPGWCIREIVRSESADDEGAEFLKPYPSLRPDLIDRLTGIEHYAISVHPYDGGFLGFLRIYNKRWDNRTTWIELVCSRDGLRWQRLSDRTPIIGLGPDGEWDSRMIAPGYSLVEEGGGHWFYYDSWAVPHCADSTQMPDARCCVGRAFIPRRRLMECVAGGVSPHMWTYPMILQGDTLKLDGSAQGGEIRASVQRFDGSVPEGFAKEDSTPLTGAFTEGAIMFRGGSLRQFGNQPVRIVIHMTPNSRVWALGVV
jgi:hypothetical protein